MEKYWVYDELNGTPENARPFEAFDPEDAATDFAENDHDGQMDNLYCRADGYPVDACYGHPVVVICPDGSRKGFKVSIEEYTPVFGAFEEE